MHSLAEMWAETERTNKAAIHEQKLKSVYLAPEDGSHVNGIREEEEGELGESRVMDESVSLASFVSLAAGWVVSAFCFGFYVILFSPLYLCPSLLIWMPFISDLPLPNTPHSVRSLYFLECKVDASWQGFEHQAFTTPHSPKRQEGQHGHQDGMSKWTVEQEKEYDSRLFRNGGHSYWETKQLPYVPPAPKGSKVSAAQREGEGIESVWADGYLARIMRS